ncbi:MAG: hypothetical protein QM328_06495 [Acidobacteriota bacterium]|nr:hypothetical protein [Acidobacteriota bacterium]
MPVGVGPGVPTDALYNYYVERGDAECRIDELKNGCFFGSGREPRIFAEPRPGRYGCGSSSSGLVLRRQLGV